MMQDVRAEAPLSGLIVLDFTRVLAGPFCSALLADLGARVIKVEPPHGDDQRHMGAMIDGESLNFAQINRNKQSLRLDMKQEAAREIALRLADRADVVIENFRPGVADRLGIGYEALAARNPGVIYCSISGFGQSGPFATRPSYDVVAQAMSGFMSVTGPEDGEPVFAGDSIGDTVAGLFGAWAIATALYQRERTGRGQHLDVAMFDSLISLLPTAIAQYQHTGQPPKRSGHMHPLTAPFGAFQARDGRVIIAVANAVLFERLCTLIGRSELTEDPRFVSDADRRSNEAELRHYIEYWTRTRDVEQALAELERAGVPASPVWTVAQAVESEQSRLRGLFDGLNSPVFGAYRVPRQPVQFSAADRKAQQPAPELGADGPLILSEVLGLAKGEIADLADRGII